MLIAELRWLAERLERNEYAVVLCEWEQTRAKYDMSVVVEKVNVPMQVYW